MPLPLIPLLIGGVSLLAGSYGVKKGFDAKGDFDKAESIGKSAKNLHEKFIQSMERERKKPIRNFNI